MFDFISVIFRHSFWLVVVILLLIVGGIMQMCDGISHSYTIHSIERSIRWGNTESAAEKLHEYFIDEFYSDTNKVSKKAGYLAEKAIDKCLEKKDIESAKLVYRDYKYGLSDYKRPVLYKYLKKHKYPDAEDYTPKRYGWQYGKENVDTAVVK